MSPFLSNFDDKKNEINQYFNFLQFIEKYIAQKGNVLSIDNESLSLNQNLVKVLFCWKN